MGGSGANVEKGRFRISDPTSSAMCRTLAPAASIIHYQDRKVATRRNVSFPFFWCQFADVIMQLCAKEVRLRSVALTERNKALTKGSTGVSVGRGEEISVDYDSGDRPA